MPVSQPLSRFFVRKAPCVADSVEKFTHSFSTPFLANVWFLFRERTFNAWEIFANKQSLDPFNPRIKSLFLFIAFFEFHEKLLRCSLPLRQRYLFFFFFSRNTAILKITSKLFQSLSKVKKKERTFFYFKRQTFFWRIKISMKKFRIGHFCFGIASRLINRIFHVCYRSMKC